MTKTEAKEKITQWIGAVIGDSSAGSAAIPAILKIIDAIDGARYPKFKVGDKVRIKDNRTIGIVGYVAIDIVYFLDNPKVYQVGYFNEDELEKVAE